MSFAKKIATLTLAIALLMATSLRPKPAMALDAWAWAGIGIASYLVFVVTMTAIIFGGQSAPLAEDGKSSLEENAEPGTLQFGTNCRSSDGNVPIACW
jgi:hypothetical protein